MDDLNTSKVRYPDVSVIQMFVIQIPTVFGYCLFKLFVKYYLVIKSIVKASAISKLNDAITLTLVMNIGVGNLTS